MAQGGEARDRGMGRRVRLDWDRDVLHGIAYLELLLRGVG